MKDLDKIKASNNIFYILELNKCDAKEIKEIFNNVLKMYMNKIKGKFF